ncbi:DUF5008 domain-containing protein [Desertivirga brevis]|uniref:DUF5008 domain-containing protein n=1 Tax=Desertivirga brevis TaxID=2810310 RepID=UPI001A97361A|nr:DUF5008 domain-containing protein [Pedobacter sp. SYSU D00873]
MKNIYYLLSVISLTALLVGGCKKEEETFEDPYEGAKEPLGISINREILPSPANGESGAEVTIPVKGLLPYKDQVQVQFNGVDAQILSVSESSVKVKVPENASSGVTSVIVKDQVVIGPYFKVNGLVNIDPTFVATAGSNRHINQFYKMADGRNILVGAFTDYDNKGLLSPLNRIIKISDDGVLDRSFRTGRAANGDLTSIVEMGGKFIVAGAFNGYGQQGSISNITSVNSNGSVDTAQYDTYLKKVTGIIKFFPRFNGGTDAPINRLYTFNNKAIATGNFRYYVKRIYSEPNYLQTRDSIILDSTEVRQIIRLSADGSLDKTYRFDQTGKALAGANGFIDSYMHTSGPLAGKVVIFGKFSRFDGQAANNIVRLNADGTIDGSFTVGSGTDNNIGSLTYNELTGKYLITGSFTRYNGHVSPGIAMLNSNGSPDNSFIAKEISGGYANFAKQLTSGLVVVSGGFKTYSGISRSGFMILNPDGTLATKYNNTGRFSGNLNDVIEMKNADQKNSLLLIGGFTRFDNQELNNIIRVTIE